MLELRELIGEALAAEYTPKRAREIAFHLVDWHSEAAFLVAVQLYPEKFTKREIVHGIKNLLVHAPNHLAAAAKLAGWPVEDVFGIGALGDRPL